MTSKNQLIYHALTLEQKINIIELYEKCVSVKELCDLYKCGKTQIYNALKRKEELKKEWVKGASSKTKRRRTLENADLDEMVWAWFVDIRSRNVPVSGPLLQAKALEVAAKLGKQSFKASNGWLMSFRNRHNISRQVLAGEVKAVDYSEVKSWEENTADESKEYAEQIIFNKDKINQLKPDINISEEKHIGIDGDVCTEVSQQTVDGTVKLLEPKIELVSDDEENEEDIESSIKTYSNALKSIQELQNFSIKVNNAKLLNILYSARREIEKSIYAESSDPGTTGDFVT